MRDKYAVWLQPRKGKARNANFNITTPLPSSMTINGISYHFSSMDDIEGTIVYSETDPRTFLM